MKVAVIGAGFTGLSAAIELADKNIQVVVFESSNNCGGLAKGFNEGKWKWNLEHFYHHIFTNDKDVIGLAKKVDCKFLIFKPKTTSYFRSKEIDLDSPASLLNFSGISFWSRIHMGVGLAILKIIPNGKFLEKYKATQILPILLGPEGYKTIWEKLLSAKFGPYKDEVNLAWFWSRINKRTKNLGYFEGGFDNLIEKCVRYIKNKGGEIRLNNQVHKIIKIKDGVNINGEFFDAVILTVPAPVIKKIFPEYEYPELSYLWGQTLIVEISRKFLRGYWMNILEENFPFLVAVEHTNMIDKKFYNGNRIIYLGNYLADGNKQLKMTKEKLLALYLPYLKRINKGFSKRNIKNIFLFREPYAQPVFPLNYSQKIPAEKIGSKVYMANMSMVYPFDRGTNYAVKAGKEVAERVIAELR